MRTIEIEGWALRVLEQVQKGIQPEGDAVELKAEWPTSLSKTARRLAAHANAARGSNILWLIGVDERRGIVGAPQQELSNWFAQVQAEFDSVWPTLQAVTVSWKDTAVAALCFETNRAPYLVKNPSFGQAKGEAISLEVPWREGAATRTANRSELLLMLADAVPAPKIEILDGQIVFQSQAQAGQPPMNTFAVSITLYVTPQPGRMLAFPFHRAKVELTAESKAVCAPDGRVFMQSATSKQTGFPLFSYQLSRGSQAGPPVTVTGMETVEATQDDIILRGPAKIRVTTDCVALEDSPPMADIQMQLVLVEAISDARVVIVSPATLPNPELRPLVWQIVRNG